MIQSVSSPATVSVIPFKNTAPHLQGATRTKPVRFGEKPKKDSSPPKKKSHFPGRKAFFGIATVVNGGILAAGAFFPPAWGLLGVTVPLTAIGVHDSMQTKHALRRNYPLLARGRWIAEAIRPEIRQYWMESDTDGKPFSRLQRETVYKRATGDIDTLPFGTQEDVYEIGRETITHSVAAIHPPEEPPKINIGGPNCKQPYESSLLNVSAMSFGALSMNAVLALSKAAKMGGFLHNTGEGGISPYHLGINQDINDPDFDYKTMIDELLKPGNKQIEEAGDLVWQLGTGYFGARNPDGTFNPEEFARKAALKSVKMIELKLSQGAKAGHGGILPGKKVTPGIAKLRGVEPWKDCLSPPGHSAFSTPVEMMHFIQELRELSGGKPVGFKLCVGRKHEVLALVKAMLETGITPDFITIDGSEGGTGAAPREFSDSVGLPSNDGLLFVHNALVGTNLRDKISLIAAGKIIDGFDILAKLARGADVTYSARGMMFSIGCIQALQCHTNTCPTGVATQDPQLVYGLDPNDKSVRAYRFHKETIKSFMELIAAAGLSHPSQLKPWHIERRVSEIESKPLPEVLEYIPKGSLLSKNIPASFKPYWEMADPNSFSPAFEYHNEISSGDEAAKSA